MTKQEQGLFKQFRNNLIGAMAALSVSILVGMVAFYFNTTEALAQSVKKTDTLIKKVKIIEKELNTLTYTPKMQNLRISRIEQDINEIKERMKEAIKGRKQENETIINMLIEMK